MTTKTPGPCHAQLNEYLQPCVYDENGWVATCQDMPTAELFARAPLFTEAQTLLIQAADKLRHDDDCTFDSETGEPCDCTKDDLEKAINALLTKLEAL